jgi:pyruvate/2-oxoglutarate dehydrogenase complex dihydrolipoamide acyltransferase (E2) component
VAILGIHKIAEKPVVRGGQIVIRQMSTFGLSFDHRLIDGHTAVQFLHRLIGYLEDPQLLLLRLR